MRPQAPEMKNKAKTKKLIFATISDLRKRRMLKKTLLCITFFYFLAREKATFCPGDSSCPHLYRPAP
jgi:hypothetical protein